MHENSKRSVCADGGSGGYGNAGNWCGRGDKGTDCGGGKHPGVQLCLSQRRQKEIMTVAYTNTVYNEKDYNTLCRIVEAEAGGEDTVGKIMVANVILNRWLTANFRTRSRGSVSSGQFSPDVQREDQPGEDLVGYPGGGETGTGAGRIIPTARCILRPDGMRPPPICAGLTGA